jgi:hypothetical protein
MITRCDKCKKIYDDFDHLTYCPHEGFAPSPSYDRMVAEGIIKRYIPFIDPALK